MLSAIHPPCTNLQTSMKGIFGQMTGRMNSRGFYEGNEYENALADDLDDIFDANLSDAEDENLQWKV